MVVSFVVIERDLLRLGGDKLVFFLFVEYNKIKEVFFIFICIKSFKLIDIKRLFLFIINKIKYNV